jgi:hypothetical protein
MNEVLGKYSRFYPPITTGNLIIGVKSIGKIGGVRESGTLNGVDRVLLLRPDNPLFIFDFF